MFRKLAFGAGFMFYVLHGNTQSIVTEKNEPGSFCVVNAIEATPVLVDAGDIQLVSTAAHLFRHDIKSISGKEPALLQTVPVSAKNIIIIGTLTQSSLIKQLAAEKKIKADAIKNKWEAFLIQTVRNPFRGIDQALVIAGSDRRGAAFGVFELSAQSGVSPWYWWADVPIEKKKSLYIKGNTLVTDAPKVKFRGIFINDEAPALSGWSKEKFGGFNHQFYSKVFELILRLKGNYLWPAMWGNAFYDDDSLNIKTADQYGIVIGTSHHEPLMRAHDEWRRYGKGQRWDYDSTEAGLKEFWREGMQRAWNEKIVSVGMRGDGDRPMSRETATSLLERIVKDQRQIIADVTGKPAGKTPQLWALYKEVQDYYDKGMRVPDDVTLLLCDDNWGNIRRLPGINDKPRAGGYGIYYHFDYVGGPRNYKWLNTNPIPRVWEQMHLAYEYGVKQIWIVNVGDIKPMEFPISFFLDYAWNPDKIGADDLQKYTDQWASTQFGKKHAKEIGNIISKYSKFNGRRKPELLDANTYSLPNYNEFANMVGDYNALLTRAEKVNDELSVEYRDAYFQLVLHPVKACANLNEMYYYAALNREAVKNKHAVANEYADNVKRLYERDSMITLEYHRLNNGKWNHMMDQTHIGYTYWQQPPVNRMPKVEYVPSDAVVVEGTNVSSPVSISAREKIPGDAKGNVFYEKDGYVSIGAEHYTHAENGVSIAWKVLPDLGRTGSAITTFPVTSLEAKPGISALFTQYDFYTYSDGEFELSAYFSPTLNFHNTDSGLQYAISLDDETPQVISINKEDNDQRTWNNWVANNIIIKTTKHRISGNGKHTVKYWMVDPGVILQKLVLDFGGVKPSYLGPPETIFDSKMNNNEK